MVRNIKPLNHVEYNIICIKSTETEILAILSLDPRVNGTKD